MVCDLISLNVNFPNETNCNSNVMVALVWKLRSADTCILEIDDQLRIPRKLNSLTNKLPNQR